MKPLSPDDFGKKLDELVRAGVLNRVNNKVEISEEFKMRLRYYYNKLYLTDDREVVVQRAVILSLVDLVGKIGIDDLTHYYYIILTMCDYAYEQYVKKLGKKKVDKLIDEGLQKTGVG